MRLSSVNKYYLLTYVLTYLLTVPLPANSGKVSKQVGVERVE